MAGIKTSLAINTVLSQTLAMTPQLQQAIRLLQLSTLELNQEIQAAIDSNPLLELDEKDINSNFESLEALEDYNNKDNSDFDPFDNDASINVSDVSLNSDIYENDNSDRIIDTSNLLNINNENSSIKDNSNFDTNYTSQSKKNISIDNDDVFEGETTETLFDHLMFQLNCTSLTGADRDIAVAIIDGIDDSGYLKESLDEILKLIQKKYPNTEIQDIKTIQKLIQNFEPLGVGSSSIQEFLIFQLKDKEFPQNAEFMQLMCTKILTDYFDLLLKKDFKTLCQKLHTRDKILKLAINYIQSLKPRPNDLIFSEKNNYIIPDVIVYKDEDNKYVVRLNDNASPKVKLNEEYRALSNSAKNIRDKEFFKKNLQEANWFIQSINKRNDTLFKVASCIVEHQQDFFEYGESAMKPLALKNVAEQIEMHESTVSRITTEKYILTPRGTFELKYFFSSQLNTESGDSASSTAIRSLIKQFINEEDKKKPLSDSKLSAMLKDHGMVVARRTVAKYRESLGIEPSSQRKQLL